MKKLACLSFVCVVAVCCSCNLRPLADRFLGVFSDQVAAWDAAIDDALVAAAQK